jgi:hypothetical protein
MNVQANVAKAFWLIESVMTIGIGGLSTADPFSMSSDEREAGNRKQCVSS